MRRSGRLHDTTDRIQLQAGPEWRRPCRLVLFASAYAVARLLVDILLLHAQAEAERDLESLALRHEVAILRRQVKRPDLVPADRKQRPFAARVGEARGVLESALS